ncbi:hypothetical protein BJ165DRAFT_1597274 [Panaeolus papilionaceus]|nr:hypothetical protein BJ165DRAFT_1597274 [Panaeolus papilionaceus]
MASEINTIDLTPSAGATQRAAKVDPNEGKCVLRNCPSSPENPVTAVSVYSKRYYADKKRMQAIEWSWNMQIGTLNLDTRENIIFLSNDLKDWFERGHCFLVPEQRIVNLYLKKRHWGGVEARSRFPPIQEPSYNYTFAALSSMSDVVIKRYDGTQMTEHKFPFTTLPRIVSHMHPKFAMLHCGQTCRDLLRDEDRKRLHSSESNCGRSLGKLFPLSLMWTELSISRWVKDYDRTYEDGFGGDDDRTERTRMKTINDDHVEENGLAAHLLTVFEGVWIFIGSWSSVNVT